MIQYPDLSTPASNYNYPPPPVEEQQNQIPFGIPIQNQQYVQLLPITIYPEGFTNNNEINRYEVKSFPTFAIQMRCPTCNTNMVTRVETHAGCLAAFSSILICSVGLFCGCCLIPFFMDCCKNSYHYCSKCNYFLGSNACHTK